MCQLSRTLQCLEFCPRPAAESPDACDFPSFTPSLPAPTTFMHIHLIHFEQTWDQQHLFVLLLFASGLISSALSMLLCLHSLKIDFSDSNTELFRHLSNSSWMVLLVKRSKNSKSTTFPPVLHFAVSGSNLYQKFEDIFGYYASDACHVRVEIK